VHHPTAFARILLAGAALLAPACDRTAAPPRALAGGAGRRSAVAAERLPAAVAAAIESPDRTPEDRALDRGRRPGDLLAFFGVVPGMRVAELGAGGGYTSELLARVVGPTGVVYGHNTPFILARFAERPWSARLAKLAMARVVRVDREFDDPLPPDIRDLDLVLIVLFYHDTVWMGVDRARMNAAVFRSLRPGGVYGIVDHSGRPGSGTGEAETLHRIEEEIVRAEVEAAGFRLAAEADFLRNPSDPRDWNAAPSAAGDRRGTSDRFVLKFVKAG
jgi:predicted methyltransferase